MSRRTEFLRRWVTALCLLALPAVVSAYVTQKDSSDIYVVVWPPGPITMQNRLPLPLAPLLDGSTTYTAPILAAMQQWNDVMGTVRLQGQVSTPPGYATGNGINEIAMDSKADGEDFGENTLAITMSYRVGNEKTEADIVFNTAYTWDSYRGPLRIDRHDIQRVAAHELGHVLGLGHPDEANPVQYVVALMNSRVSSSVETPRTDDINGIRSLYGAPGFVPANDHFAQAAVLQLADSSVSVTGTNIAATAEPGEPDHDTEKAARSVWWRWTAPGSAPVTLTTMGSNFDTVVGVYTGGSVGSLTKIASNDDEDRGVVRTSKLTFNPVAGTTYAIAVDGWEASFGQIALTLTQAAAPDGAPSITTQPSGQTVGAGGSATFVVSAAGVTTYQWYLNGSPISGATAASFTRSNVSAADAGSYFVVVTNAAGSVTSNPATLTVQSAVVTNQAVTSGREVTLAAPVVAGTFQWQVSTNAGASWSDVSNGAVYTGSTTSTLTINSVTTAMNGNRYRYVNTTAGGTATGAAITLTVAPSVLSFPEGVAIDATGNLYVTDSATHVVLKIDLNRQATTLAGASGSAGSADGTGTAARFNQPTGIYATTDGYLTVSDTGNATIRRIVFGAVTTLAGSTVNRGNTDGAASAATFSLPTGVALDSSSSVYVADATNHTIRKLAWDAAYAVSTFAGTAGSSGATDGTGTAARFNYPTGVTFDIHTSLFVADTTNNLIRKITPAGTVSTHAGVVGGSGWQDGTGSGALFNQPRGLARDNRGNIYVADTGNSVIRKITREGVVTTLAGLSTIGGLKDGTGSEAWFNQPRGLTVDSDGNVYVADTGNAAIRKITPDGRVTTLALTAGSSAGGSTGGGTGSGGGTVTPPSGGGSSGGGGGGAPSLWFFGAVSGLALLRWWRRRRA